MKLKSIGKFLDSKRATNIILCLIAVIILLFIFKDSLKNIRFIEITNDPLGILDTSSPYSCTFPKILPGFCPGGVENKRIAGCEDEGDKAGAFRWTTNEVTSYPRLYETRLLIFGYKIFSIENKKPVIPSGCKKM